MQVEWTPKELELIRQFESEYDRGSVTFEDLNGETIVAVSCRAQGREYEWSMVVEPSGTWRVCLSQVLSSFRANIPRGDR